MMISSKGHYLIFSLEHAGEFVEMLAFCHDFQHKNPSIGIQKWTRCPNKQDCTPVAQPRTPLVY